MANPNKKVPKDVQRELVESILAANTMWKFPKLQGVVDAPTLRSDGTVLDRRGYDDATGIYYDPGDTWFPPITANPTPVPDFEPNSDQPIKLTEDRSWQHAVLSSREGKETRYLARQLSWRLTIEDHPAYILKPRDPRDFDDLIDRLGRPKYKRKEGGKRAKGPKEPPRRLDPTFERLQDSDVVIGVAGAKTPEGVEVSMDQIFPIEDGQLTPPGLGAYFDQLADNYGLSDEDRAYNFLVARYAAPAHDLDDLDKDFELAGVPTMHSRLGGADRRIVRVIYTFNGKGPNAPIRRQYFVRVDVTDEFPFIVTPWHRYLQRGEET